MFFKRFSVVYTPVDSHRYGKWSPFRNVFPFWKKGGGELFIAILLYQRVMMPLQSTDSSGSCKKVLGSNSRNRNAGIQGRPMDSAREIMPHFLASSLGHYQGTMMTRWSFQILFVFILSWGRFPVWLIFFRWVGSTTNQVIMVSNPLMRPSSYLFGWGGGIRVLWTP